MNLDAAIIHHLTSRDLADQSELLALLHGEGFELTLSTLSRHLKKLQVHKVGGRYQVTRHHGSGIPPYTLRKVPPTLLIIKTSPGYGQALAFALDESTLPSLAGTIAGDDTIFVAPTDVALLDQLEQEILERLEREP